MKQTVIAFVLFIFAVAAIVTLVSCQERAENPDKFRESIPYIYGMQPAAISSLKEHHCSWEDCELQGQITFHSTWNYEPYTDGWCCEKTHWDHPTWTYEQCEDYVFTPMRSL